MDKMPKGLFKSSRFRFLFLIVMLVIGLIIDEVSIHLFKNHQVIYIAVFHRLITLPNTFALDTSYTATHPGISYYGSKNENINIGYDVSKIPEFIERTKKVSTVLNESRCGIEIHRFMNVKQSNQNMTMFEDDKEYMLMSLVDEKVVEKVIGELCNNHPVSIKWLEIPFFPALYLI
jgi:hypothetical protein